MHKALFHDYCTRLNASRILFVSREEIYDCFNADFSLKDNVLSCRKVGPLRQFLRIFKTCNRAVLMYGIMAVHDGHAYIGMVEGLPREISEVIHHTYGCIGFTRTA